MKTVCLSIALLFCIPAGCQVLKDTIFLTNGSIVVGKFKKAKLGVVIFDPDDAGDITVQLRKLKTISARRRVFRIETVDDHFYFGIILPHPSPNFIYIARATDTITARLEYISVMYPIEKSALRRFTGKVGVGFSYTRSSGFGRLNYDANINYASKKTEVGFSVSGVYTLYDSLLSRDNEAFSFKYNYYFSGNWFASAFLAYQRNLELGLARRFQEGLGIGNKFITSRYVYTWGRAGFVFNQEKNTEGAASGVLTELFGQIELNVFKFENPKINFLLEQSIYYSLSEKGRFRNDGSLSITWEIFKDFKLEFSPYNNYDSKPPGGEGSNFDYGTNFGINYIF